MADYIVDGAHLESIANAIREKTNTTDGIRLADMGAKIKSINISNPTPTPEISAGTGGIIDVVKLPTEDISESSFYRLMTATVVHNQQDMTEYSFICYCVDGLPEVGLPATNTSMDILNIYYNVQDGVASGYIDEMLSAGLSIPSGWYEISTLLVVADTTYGGTITAIDDDPCDDAVRLLLKYDFYINKNGWMKLPFAYEKAPEFDIQWDGVIGDRFALDLSLLGYEGTYLVKMSDKVPSFEQLLNSKFYAPFWSESYIDIFEEMLDTQMFPGCTNITLTFGSTMVFAAIVHNSDELNPALGLPSGYLTNGIYFISNGGDMYVKHLVSKDVKITKIDSKFIEADFSEYAKTTYVDAKINQAIGNAIGGSY